MNSPQLQNEIYASAIEAGLISVEEAERLICFFERQTIHPITALIGAGVSELRLYQVFAERSGLPLDLAPLPVAAEKRLPVSAEHLAYFDAIAVEAAGDGLSVASWRWDRRNVIPTALANLAGVPVSLVLVTYSAFERLSPRLHGPLGVKW